MFDILYDFNTTINRIDQQSVWNYIIGYPVSIGQKITNPLRPDKHANCYLYRYGGNILLADWANREYHGIGVVKALQAHEKLPYQDTIKKLNSSVFLLPSSYSLPLPIKKKDFKFKLDFKYRNYNKNDVSYWSDYGITTDILYKEEIYPVQYYFRNSRRDPDTIIQCKAEDTAYGIDINGRKKLYQPYSTDFKWLTTFNEYDIGGKVNKDSDILIITKSFKDYLVLKYHTPYNVQFVPSESINLNTFYIDVIKDTYTKIIVLMDNDSTGHKAAKRISKQIGSKAEGLWLEEANDPAEYYKMFNNLNIITEIIENDTTNYTQILASNNRKILSG